MSLTVTGRPITLSAIRDAALHLYAAAVRTPLIRVELPPRCGRRCGRSLSSLGGSIVVSLDEVARAMKLGAERAHVIAEGTAGCAVAAALGGLAGAGKVVAVVSGGNIDLSRFASRVNHQH